jgi:hypothetical protein
MRHCEALRSNPEAMEGYTLRYNRSQVVMGLLRRASQ